ncbi:unnamed protein product [Aphanomyces euteiches]
MTTPMDPTTPATSQSTVSKGKQGDEKRRNWTEDEDIVLLRQVAADLPFLAPYGKNWRAGTLSQRPFSLGVA